jgi:hypothetical protein
VIGLPLKGTGFGLTVTVSAPVTPGVAGVVPAVVDDEAVLGEVGVLELPHDELTGPATKRNTTGHRAKDFRNIRVS